MTKTRKTLFYLHVYLPTYRASIWTNRVQNLTEENFELSFFNLELYTFSEKMNLENEFFFLLTVFGIDIEYDMIEILEH